ncbi:endonuclease/exonuclease/phosphatase family protein [Actinokineospora terrae]|uniref:Endonuclease/Exonuclease/phosphatase family protein n=1 Tax=Actinokineospora terrae TaxID=155974 RepID=A0A1H9KT99_9PSEU|nr:endonuclease/exonuclease/phosphatase family protein [Actinokineospora terrae]SER02411.1 Endonuclease/Exonuclease/phosphatase family protein [Actinokineospora terrae]
MRARGVWLSAVVAVGVLVGGAEPAGAVGIADYSFATWNMQGANYQGVSKWGTDLDTMLGVVPLVQSYNVVALQEAGSLGDIDRGALAFPPRWACQHHVKGLRRARRCIWLIDVNGVTYPRTLYFVESEDRELGVGDQNRKDNLAFVVKHAAVDVVDWDYQPPVRSDEFHDGDRGLLQLTLADGTTIHTGHADASPPGANAAALVNKVRAANAGENWVLLGDFNIEPKYLRPLLGPGERLTATVERTMRPSRKVYDYMIWFDRRTAEVMTAKVVQDRVVNGNTILYRSDHHPVRFAKQN